MFTYDTTIAAALAARPALREILPAFHPAFAKLNHPVLGKILPKLVNVRDAARVAGVDPDALLQVMNLPGAPHPGPPPAATARTSAPTPPWLRDPEVLDVRPRLAAGEEPFAAIMAALRALPAERPLTVIAPFEPAPLIRLMEGRGWLTHVAWEGDACRASFRAAPGAGVGEGSEARPVERIDGVATLDVRGLEPPEPMRQILAALDDPANRPLRVRHHREPTFLYPKLQERGLTWSVRPVGDDVELEIDGP